MTAEQYTLRIHGCSLQERVNLQESSSEFSRELYSTKFNSNPIKLQGKHDIYRFQVLILFINETLDNKVKTNLFLHPSTTQDKKKHLKLRL